MEELNSKFRDSIINLVAQIPSGRVMTYGDIALLAGHPMAARVVGQVAHYGSPDLPWHRVVNRFGGLAAGYYGGREGQKRMLEQEGIVTGDRYIITGFDALRWRPGL